MNLVDSSGWIEFFTAGPLSDKYAAYLKNTGNLIIPTIVIYEVYKKIKKGCSEEEALMAVAQMARAEEVLLDEPLALFAADVSIKYNLAMADAIVYATAIQKNSRLITGDEHFEGLPMVVFIK